jgi:hypothetical protein
MEATETGGTWAQATEVTAPFNADNQYAQLSGVSCTSAGNCVGVGFYTDSSGAEQAMETTETGGSFAQAIEVTAPPNAVNSSNGTQLLGVSCTSVGNCVGVGRYQDTSGSTQAMAATETGGIWAQATGVTTPASPFGADGVLKAVSCTSEGNCVAVGTGLGQAIEATETGGT